MAAIDEAEFVAWQREQYDTAKEAKTEEAARIDAAAGEAAELAQTAKLIPRGDLWGPTPLWTIELPSLNASLDVGADTEEEARQVAVEHIARMIASSRPA